MKQSTDCILMVSVQSVQLKFNEPVFGTFSVNFKYLDQVQESPKYSIKCSESNLKALIKIETANCNFQTQVNVQEKRRTKTGI